MRKACTDLVVGLVVLIVEVRLTSDDKSTARIKQVIVFLCDISFKEANQPVASKERLVSDFWKQAVNSEAMGLSSKTSSKNKLTESKIKRPNFYCEIRHS